MNDICGRDRNDAQVGDTRQGGLNAGLRFRRCDDEIGTYAIRFEVLGFISPCFVGRRKYNISSFDNARNVTHLQGSGMCIRTLPWDKPHGWVWDTRQGRLMQGYHFEM